jgi:hypothetical protein
LGFGNESDIDTAEVIGGARRQAKKRLSGVSLGSDTVSLHGDWLTPKIKYPALRDV